MKVLIIGAGAVGSVISKVLAKDRKVSQVICGTNDVRRSKEFLDLKNGKIRLMKLDASDVKQVSAAAKGCDIIINSSLPDFNLKIMDAALKVGADYQDLCSLLKDLRNAEQLKYDARFRKAGLVGLINAGVAPGITNLLAREIYDKMDSVSDIRIRLVEDQKGSELVFAWSPEVTLDTISAPPLTYRNGRFSFLAPFGDTEEYEFPQPVGKKYTVNLYGDEIATIPKYLNVRNVSMKSSGTDIDFSKALSKLGMFRKTPVTINGKKISPLEFFSKFAPKVPTPKEMSALLENGVIEDAMFLSAVDGFGTQSGKKVRIRYVVRYPDLKKLPKAFRGSTYISYPTGVAAASFFKTIPKIEQKGVFPPEALDSSARKHVLLELESAGIEVEETFSKA
ncbi:saccharopine dehydrogenase NADP-binding domain-containing protein [Candidatus Woesearchaeota archaeon]|nr:saccharopine dehydrogenase NADP-binding domain-containing protein [Candidatus Woesearchaeota archaeon]